MSMTWEDLTCERATLEDIDLNAVMYFQKMSVAHNRMEEETITDDMTVVLNNLNLLDEHGNLKNAAVLLFGKDPNKFFVSCDFRIGRFVNSATDLIFQDIIEGDLIRMADRVINILQSKYLISPIEMPENSLREAIINAIIHKYYIGAHTQMKVWNDRIELWNEGTLPRDITIENMMKEHSSKPRNPDIVDAFYKAGFIENCGCGITKIRNGFIEAGLPEPMFEETCGGICVTMYRPEIAKDVCVNRMIETPFEIHSNEKNDPLENLVDF